MSPERRVAAIDFVLLAMGVIALWAIPHHIGADGEVRLAALGHLLREGRFDAPRYSLVGPFFAAPFYYAGVPELFNVTLFTLFLAFTWRELRDRTLLLLLVFASMFPNHVQVFYGEPFTALLVSAGVLLLTREKTRAGWALIVLGAWNTPATAVGVLGIAIVEARRKKSYLPLLAPAVVVVLAALENSVMRGSPLRSGYETDAGFHTVMPYSGQPGFSYPFLLGVLAIVLSFGKGLLFFAPGLFVRPAADASERVRHLRRLLVAFVVGLVLVYAKWWSWYGGTFWGPRFFLAASVPACIALATHLSSKERRSPVVALALLLSFWVGVNGLVFDQTGLGICTRDDYALEMLCWFTPEFSPLWHPFVDFASSVPEKTRTLAFGVCLFWAGALGWIGRDVFVQITRDWLALVRRRAGR